MLITLYMKKYIILFLFLVTASLYCFAQQEYIDVKTRFYSNAENYRLLETNDNLNFLLNPLNELKLNRKYVLGDFRKVFTRHSIPKDVSSLRLYVRNDNKKVTDADYYDKEYNRYLSCKKNNLAYKSSRNNIPYIWPFDKIRITGSQMSIWQAYLLHSSSNIIGMRNEANYKKEYILVSKEDVDTIVTRIQDLWDSDCFYNNLDTKELKFGGTKHVHEVEDVVNSLLKIKDDELSPVFNYNKDSVTITHYVFGEFYGLAKCSTTIKLSHNHHHIIEIGKKSYHSISKYSRLVFY